MVKWGTVAGMPLPAVQEIAGKAERKRRTVKDAGRSRSARTHWLQGGTVCCKATVPLEAASEDVSQVDCGNCLRQINAGKLQVNGAVSEPVVPEVVVEVTQGLRDVKATLAPAQAEHPPALAPAPPAALPGSTNGHEAKRACRGPCHLDKPLDAFARDAKDKIHGRKQICRDCDNARRRSYPKVKAEVAA